jgi:hypothetical protein
MRRSPPGALDRDHRDYSALPGEAVVSALAPPLKLAGLLELQSRVLIKVSCRTLPTPPLPGEDAVGFRECIGDFASSQPHDFPERRLSGVVLA